MSIINKSKACVNPQPSNEQDTEIFIQKYEEISFRYQVLSKCYKTKLRVMAQCLQICCWILKAFHQR